MRGFCGRPAYSRSRGHDDFPICTAAKADLAPTGTLHVARIHANFLLVAKERVNREPCGIAPDLARELAKRLGVQVTFVSYDTPGKLAATIERNRVHGVTVAAAAAA